MKSRSVARETMSRAEVGALARDEGEKSVATHAPEALLRHVAQFPTDSERRFAFRCFWVPFQILVAFEHVFRAPTRRFWNYRQIALFFAHSRMVREMCVWGQDPCASWWPQDIAAEASRWWMGRYDAHRRAIGMSFREWVKRQCPNCRHSQQELATAAFFGLMQRVDKGGLPPGALAEVLSDMKRREQNGSRESEFFYKTALDRSEKRWPLEEIDLWLIEVWPLVQEYAWTYRDVHDLMVEKFENEDNEDAFKNAAVFDGTKHVKERCETLGLSLSELGKQTRGRPSQHDVDPGLETFCARLYRQVPKLGADPDAALLARHAQAHKGLAEVAVNLDPLTRLLEGASKETFCFAPPQTRKGGEEK